MSSAGEIWGETTGYERKLAELLYRAIVELEYVQESAALGELCATPVGEKIVNEGMALLGVEDLSTEDLPTDWTTGSRGER